MLRLNAYDKGLEKLKQDLMTMGHTVRSRLFDAMVALMSQDAEKARAIAESDDVVDEMDYSLEDQTLRLALLQQPREQDLRRISSTLRLARELERMGDYAVNIALIAIELSDCGGCPELLLNDIGKMGEETSAMLQDALQAYLEDDLDLAIQVAKRDDTVDELFRSVFDGLVDCMRKHSRYVLQASHLSLAARHLERVGDHAVNVAEMVFYLETGQRRAFRKGYQGGAPNGF